MILVKLDSAGFRAALQQLLARAQRPRTLLEAAARSVRRTLVRHFSLRDLQQNRLGGDRTHWWGAVARSTHVGSVTDRQATITISHRGIGLKVYGGTVVPREAQALTIPIHAEAHGRRAATLEMLTGTKLFRLQPKKGGPVFLVRTLGDGTLRFLYVLKTMARFSADPRALPERTAMETAATTAAAEQLASEAHRLNLT